MKPFDVFRKTALRAATVMAVAVVLPVTADEPTAGPDSKPTASQATAAPSTPAAAPRANAASPMMAHMQAMQAQMAKIRATQDPKERAALMDEHLKAMQDTMKLMMNSDGGCPMMGGGPGMGAGAGPGGMMGHHHMMQMMMDQMMQHQAMMKGPAQ